MSSATAEKLSAVERFTALIAQAVSSIVIDIAPSLTALSSASVPVYFAPRKKAALAVSMRAPNIRRLGFINELL